VIPVLLLTKRRVGYSPLNQGPQRGPVTDARWLHRAPAHRRSQRLL